MDKKRGDCWSRWILCSIACITFLIQLLLLLFNFPLHVCFLSVNLVLFPFVSILIPIVFFKKWLFVCWIESWECAFSGNKDCIAISNEEGQDNKWKHECATLASLRMYSFESSYDFSMKNDNTSNLVAHLEEIQYSVRWTAFFAFVAYHSQSYT